MPVYCGDSQPYISRLSPEFLANEIDGFIADGLGSFQQSGVFRALIGVAPPGE